MHPKVIYNNQNYVLIACIGSKRLIVLITIIKAAIFIDWWRFDVPQINNRNVMKLADNKNFGLNKLTINFIH